MSTPPAPLHAIIQHAAVKVSQAPSNIIHDPRHLSYLYVMPTLPVRGFLSQVTQWRHLRICIKSTPIRHRTHSHHTSFPSTRRFVLIAITPRQRRKTRKAAKWKALEDRRWLTHPFSPPPFEARGGNARMKGAFALSFQQCL
jgi:hypothetical protein